ncbi:MAG: sigma factor [Jhaorihella sp.]
MTPHRAYPARRPGDDRPEDVPEDVLIALARNRDEAAVRELVRRCNRQLFRAARAILHDDGEAEDVVQAAYVTGFTRLDEFRGESGLAPG